MTRNNFSFVLVGMLLLTLTLGCEREDKDLIPATYPNTAEIFIDEFSAGLEYAAFGDSKVTAFTVDENVSFEDVIGTSSMRFDIPNEGDAEGAYAGGVFRDLGGRDFTGYNVLTFYAQASKAGTINLIGFGNDFMDDKFSTTTSLKLSTSWNKYYIPIPDPAKLIQEKGLFVIAEGPEDGKGYSIWLDVVKFEKLGTLAHPRPAIMNGEDVIERTFIGVTSSLRGLSYTVNLPNGADQSVDAAPSYFTFISSDTTVAKVDELGIVSIVGEGTSKITASLGGNDATGSLTIVSLGEFTNAPIPTRDAANVISIFSDAYNNVPVDFYNGFFEPFQTTKGGADLVINNDNIIRYTDLNFVATQFTQPTVNATTMTHLHVDIQVEDQIENGDFINVQLVDFGADGAFGGGDDSEGKVTFNSPPLESGAWASLDIPLANFTGLASTANLAQLFFISDATISNILVDNMYFYKDGDGGNEPTEAAPVPTHDANEVISIFSDAYTDLEGTDYPDWGQTTVVSEVVIAGDNTLKFAGLNFQGIQLASSQDVSGLGFLHLDFWTKNSTALNTYLISTGPVEVASVLTVPTSGWTSVDIPLSSFSPVDLADIIQLKFDGNGDIYLDNMYFHTSGGGTGTEPTVAAPTPPTRDAADVISLFSNAYTNETVDTWSADWDDSDVEDVQIEGDDVKKYTFTNFAGIDFSSNKLDASGMTKFHMDIWTPDEVLDKAYSIKNVDFGGGSAEASSHILTVTHTVNGDIPALAKGSWVSIDVPISSFTGDLTRSDLAQMVLSTNLKIVYVDNIYFYKSGGGTATEPTVAAPAPPARDAADVISIFSDAYTDVSGTDFNPGWGQTTVVTTEDIASNSTLKYANFNYQGTVLGSSQDASAMEYLHVDMWTADATVVKVSPINNSGVPVENLVSLTPLTTGQWNSYDIPLTDFTGSGMSLDEIIQLKFDGQAGVNPSNIYLDNIYFHKSGGGTATEPTVAAPAPPARDAADVISIFSDAYTDVSGTDFNPGWGQTTVVTTEDIASNSTLKYANFNYQGTVLGSSQDASAMEYLHVDMWTADATVVKVSPINNSGAPVENLVSLTPLTTGQWNNYDIPLTDFTGSGMSLNEIIQLKFDGQAGVNPSNIYLDNIYFYKSAGGAAGPTVAAPTPTEDPANVVSIYSDAYTDIAFDNFDAGWCGGSAVTGVTVAGNNTLKKNTGIDCHGIDFSSNRQDLSSYTHIHFDFYTDDTDLTGDVFNVKLVDFGGGAGEASALEVNINTGTTPGIVAGSWVSVDIDITSLGGVVSNNLTRSDIAQIGITTANLTNVWYDNIYLHK